MAMSFLGVVLAIVAIVSALRYEEDQILWNLNEKVDATNPVDYFGEWTNHTFHPSPTNWRFPFYSLNLDRFVDGKAPGLRVLRFTLLTPLGDPRNDDANGTRFEHSWTSNQFRFGGDVRGLRSSLDYLHGMGVRGLYIVGSPFINLPWSGDGYGPLDFTLLDHHHGTIQDWRDTVTAIHERGMYVILDNTLATMGDLIGFEGHLNETTPFSWDEYNYVWKGSRRYHDFFPNNSIIDTCRYPRCWGQDGYPVQQEMSESQHSCYDSDFDQYGDMPGVGAVPVWQSQLAKFASVQDRLRIWRQDVMEKVKVMSCMQIAMLDIDGFRMDKAFQAPLDAQAEWADYQRDCARRYGKNNFFITGEGVGEPPLEAVYMGRGKQPNMYFENITEAQLATNQSSVSNPSAYLREAGSSALDSAAFHYPTYGALTRFLGLSGLIGSEGQDWTYHWRLLLQRDDMVNAETGQFDPRHMFGTTNQDVFRWPALSNGIERQILGFLVTQMVLPGIPLLLWGEEQAFYILENLATDYVFGRMPMASQRAWQLHGCYELVDTSYYDQPFGPALTGCHDDSVSLDHRDPSHPARNILKRMYQLRQEYPTLNDGFTLRNLSNATYEVFLPGSANIPTELGVWSVYRGRTEGVQDFSGASGHGNQGVWFVYMNENATTVYDFNCTDYVDALTSPFAEGTTVKNLFYPYDEYTLEATRHTLRIEGSEDFNGCLSQLQFDAWGFKAFVPIQEWTDPMPTITRVVPGHDARLLSRVPLGDQDTVQIEIRFSSNMSCDSVTNSLELQSTTQDRVTARLNQSSVVCQPLSTDLPELNGGVATAWVWRGSLFNVSHGIHTYAVRNATTADGQRYTDAVDRFMFRLGDAENPMVHPLSSNYTTNLLRKGNVSGRLIVRATAAGADLYSYSTNFGITYSRWLTYTGEPMEIERQTWNGTKDQGTHVILKYWSEAAGSQDHVQHSDLEERLPRRWPQAFVEGSWNQWGSDRGLRNHMRQTESDAGLWSFDLEAEWPTQVGINVWGLTSQGTLDVTAAYGDVDGDHVLDWLPPNTKSNNVVNLTERPPLPHIGWRLLVNDASYSYEISPVGSVWSQLVVALLLALVPVITAIVGVLAFRKSYYNVFFNTRGETEKKGLIANVRHSWRHSFTVLEGFRASRSNSTTDSNRGSWRSSRRSSLASAFARVFGAHSDDHDTPGLREKSRAMSVAADSGAPNRRTTLMATMEYEIEDWSIKVKIGGLGVMSSLMGKSLGHQDLIWVVPCVGEIDYPEDTPAAPVMVKVLDHVYRISIQYHQLRNITFVLLDAPVFRRQTKAEPYPARMDDLDSAIYYSAWNACIAEMIRRFKPDLYHINDYHGALAPLYLLPATIPVSLSLHNAEFQGMWPLRNRNEMQEVSETFNLDEKIIKEYVQFGEVFNMLHAAASYLRIHQAGYGAVGVSKKYGGRSWARYPIFWGLSKIGSLPNPDPTDTLPWDASTAVIKEAPIDMAAEEQRGILRRQAQEWAGLNVDAEADLFLFVGRWSMQKGVDLIADVFFSILEQYPKTQLICIGPVIDLYGKFTALKLERMMAKYPGRVFSKPEFTALPPFIFSGAEFALIPSRDEPFGLVAVEAGRNGALGVGSRVGGLGQMPGWWYSIESTSTRHLLSQFNTAIVAALSSSQQVRAQMRAFSALQRFPVAQWLEDLELLQTKSIEKHNKHRRTTNRHSWSQFLHEHTRSHTTSNSPEAPVVSPEEVMNEKSLGEGEPNSVDTVRFSNNPFIPSSDVNSTGYSRRPSVDSVELGPREPRRKVSFFEPDHGDVLTSSHNNALQEKRRGSLFRKGDQNQSGDADDQVPPITVRDFAISPTVVSERQASVGTSLPQNASDGQDQRRPTLASEDFTNEPIPELDEETEDVDSLSESEENQSSDDEDREDTVNAGQGSPTLLTPAHGTASEIHSNSDATSSTVSSSGLASDSPNEQSHSPGADIDKNSSPALTTVKTGSSNGKSDGSHRKKPLKSAYSRGYGTHDKRLSLRQVRGVGNGVNYNLQRVIPSFTDRKGSYAYKFGELLETVDAQSSVNTLCIEDYLKTSEKHFFGRYARAKLGLPHHSKPSHQQSDQTTAPPPPPLPSSPAADIVTGRRPTLRRIDVPAPDGGSAKDIEVDLSRLGESSTNIDDTVQPLASGRRDTVFNLGKDYVAPRGIPNILQRRVVGDWQVYAFLLALGHILSANSYQITLLQSQLGQTITRAYVIGAIYCAASIGWWLVFRYAQARYVLSVPWFFYGLAFFLIGMGPYANYLDGTRGWLFSVATGFYTIAAASGSLFFSLNFGTEGGTPVSTWVLRAAVIQGLQQLYVAGLWRAGASLIQINARTKTSNDTGSPSGLLTSNASLTAITIPIAALLWTIGLFLYLGLPAYYRQRPGFIPSFYKALLRRKVVLWFFVTVILQNYFLSTVYGRTWRYLFASQHAPTWAVGLMLVAFFVGLWAVIMTGLYFVSREHSWVPPILGICLGAPRWCQELWAVSGIAAFVPWGGPVTGALLGRALWLWLGVLDELQGVGLGMILLQTLPRFHVAATLVACQAIGSVATIVARSASPVRRGPGDVFPNFALEPHWGLTRAWFWIALFAQIIICLGFLKFFRKEQLFKP
ncbi:hypothetical protein LTR61_003949 [Exophiala xenobiotica]|nr:hypothetical protein LTR61_003949 [Exophiala xenobiotica]